MARPKVERTVYMLDRGVDRLIRYYRDSSDLVPRFQYLVAELVMLRLFSILEEAIEEVACKLVAGASYTNGNHPNLLYTARSQEAAKGAMSTYQRSKPQTLRWGRSSDIRDSVRKVIDTSDPFCHQATVHGNLLNEMRTVRNRVAHVGTNSREGFRQVIRQRYGANPSMQIGAFLTSTQRHQIAKLDEYLTTTKVMVADLAKGE